MASGLRRDLETIYVDGSVRPYRIIVDEISGKFSRISDNAWERLKNNEADPSLWAEASLAGWTRQRSSAPAKRFSLLSVRIRIGEIDTLAKVLSTWSGLFFSVPAMLCWSVVIFAAAIVSLGRSVELTQSLGSLATFLSQSDPVLIGAMFILTKACHELAHAVMCRRMGARCGDVGVMFLCGMPCPFVEVTSIWRQPSRLRRAAVMIAGIYIELIIASIATFVWILASDDSVRMMALNLMIVCSVSTILFNANPLMRYDGYFVLADLLGSANLRQEARNAFRDVFVRRLGGVGYQSTIKSDRKTILLGCYHIASKIYRVVVSCAIAALLIGFAEWLHVRSFAIVLVLVAFAMIVARNSKRVKDILRGKGRWNTVPPIRRVSLVGMFTVFFAVLLFAPMPRYRRASGIVDAANAVSIFLPESERIQSVHIELGQRVKKGQLIVRLDDTTRRMDAVRNNGQFRLAKLRRNLSHRHSLDGSGSTHVDNIEHWKTLQATEESARVQLATSKSRLSELSVRSPVAGIVIPGKPKIGLSELGNIESLIGTQGSLGTTRDPWCRVCPTGTLHVALVIDARDRPRIQIGSTTMVSLASRPDDVIATRVVSVSEIKKDKRLAVNQSAYQVLCEIPSVHDERLLSMIGQECRGVFRLPSSSIAGDIIQWLGDWIRG